MSKKEQLELLDCLNSAMVLVSKYQKIIEPFLDDYFRGLQPSDIAELAKKSIRLTEENRRLEEENENLQLAEQLINGLLQEFDLTNYDWRYDQNEIHTLLKDKFNHNIKALDKIEKIVKKATELPCVFSCDCDNCAEKPTKNGDTCIQGAIFKIADIIKKVKN